MNKIKTIAVSIFLACALQTGITKPNNDFIAGTRIGFATGVASTLATLLVFKLIEGTAPESIQHYTAKKMIKYFLKWLLAPTKYWNTYYGSTPTAYPAVTVSYRI